MSSKLLPLDTWASTMYFESTALAKANTFQQLSLLKLWASKCPFYFLWSSIVLNHHVLLHLPKYPFSVNRQTYSAAFVLQSKCQL